MTTQVLSDERLREIGNSDVAHLGEAQAMAAELLSRRAAEQQEPVAQCCMCGKTGLSTIEGDGGPECQLSDGRWTCSAECYDRAASPQPPVPPDHIGDANEMVTGHCAKCGLDWNMPADAAGCDECPRRIGQHFTIEHDAFSGVVIGHYTTLEGKQGVVLQQDGTRVVHVYGSRWLAPK